MLTYSLHRVIGIRNMDSFNEEGRFAIVKKFKSHIILYTLISLVVSLWLFFELPHFTKSFIIFAGIISLGYALPIFSKGKRLRDFNMIKIWLIAITWSLVTETIILYENDATNFKIIASFVERFAFLVAITIPFDIRDLKVDDSANVKTIATQIGKAKAIKLSYLFLSIAMIVAMIHRESPSNLIPITVCYITAFILIHLGKDKDSDVWFSGALDGVMLVPITTFSIFQFLH